MSFSLIDEYRKRILDVCINTRTSTSYRFLVLDAFTSQLVGAVLPDTELVKHNITAVQRIEQRRDPRPAFDAIYILSSQKYIVQCLISDFQRQIPRYKGGYVYFVPMLDRENYMALQNADNTGYIKDDFKPLLIDYNPIQSNVFSFKYPDALPVYFNQNCFSLVQSQIEKTTKRLVSVCTTLGEYPIIRYYRPPNPPPAHQAYTLSYMLADALQKGLKSYADANPQFPWIETDRPRSIFLVLDRSVDLKGPFLHELSYEAMEHDLLNMDENNIATMLPQDDQENAIDALTEKDPVWVELRHMYIPDAIGQVAEKTRIFERDHKEFSEIEKASTGDLKTIMLNMKGYMREKALLTLHFNTVETLNDLTEKIGLIDVIEVEQILATGLRSDGKVAKNVIDDLVPLLDDQKVSSRDRISLLGLYLLYREGLIDSDLRKLCAHAKLATEDAQLLVNMKLLGGRIIKESLQDRRIPKPTQSREVDMQHDQILTRYTIALEEHLMALAQNILDPALFPFITDPSVSADSLSYAASTSSTTLPRRTKAQWHDRSPVRGPPPQRIFVFIAGGMTYAETRVAYEISKKFNKDVIIGSEDFLTPQTWQRELGRLDMSLHDLNLADLRPEPKVPAYLFEPDVEPAPVKVALQQRQAASLQVPAANAPNKISRVQENHHRTATGHAPGHFDVEKNKKKGKWTKLFK
ncbi:Sec1-like protein [Limtongia smithiae]|uniref:Sec1-like protein n=1 Tax=Limtongia smithiae TaxID=1125753 RepID=UPI0034CF278A